MTTSQLEVITLRRELKRARLRTYKIALVIGLIGAVPVYVLKESAPWAIAIPICLGAIINGIMDWRESRKKRDAFYVDKLFVVQALEHFYAVPRRAVRVPSSSIHILIEREQFEAQAREVTTSNSRLKPCYA